MKHSIEGVWAKRGVCAYFDYTIWKSTCSEASSISSEMTLATIKIYQAHRIRMYAILMVTFTINKNPSHVSINLPAPYGSVMGHKITIKSQGLGPRLAAMWAALLAAVCGFFHSGEAELAECGEFIWGYDDIEPRRTKNHGDIVEGYAWDIVGI